MKKLALGLSVAIAVFGSVAYVSAQAEKVADNPGEKGMVVGDAIELSTFAMKGNCTGDNQAAGKARAEQGFPVGIIEEETGALWVCVFRDPAPASHLETGNNQLAPFIGQKVVSQGFKYTNKNFNLIRMSIVSEY